MFFILISTHLHAKFVSFPNIATESLPNFARSLIVHFLKTERMPQQTEVLNVLHPKSMHFLHVFFPGKARCGVRIWNVWFPLANAHNFCYHTLNKPALYLQ
jgi:hypothetical protein